MFRKLNKKVAKAYYNNDWLNWVDIIGPVIYVAVLWIPINAAGELFHSHVSLKLYIGIYVIYSIIFFLLFFKSSVFKHNEEFKLVQISLPVLTLIFFFEFIFGVPNFKFHFLGLFIIWNLAVVYSLYAAVVIADREQSLMFERGARIERNYEIAQKALWDLKDDKEKHRTVAEEMMAKVEYYIASEDFKAANELFVENASLFEKVYKQFKIRTIKERIRSEKNYQCKRCGDNVRQWYKPSGGNCYKNSGNSHYYVEL